VSARVREPFAAASGGSCSPFDEMTTVRTIRALVVGLEGGVGSALPGAAAAAALPWAIILAPRRGSGVFGARRRDNDLYWPGEPGAIQCLAWAHGALAKWGRNITTPLGRGRLSQSRRGQRGIFFVGAWVWLRMADL